MTDDKPPPFVGSPDGPPGTNVAPGLPAAAVTEEPLTLKPIPLAPAPAAKSATPALPAKKEPETKDTFRELIETIVFVVVLVLMLKTFLAEAFVIPTGSMADTLLGYHHKVTCAQCGYPNLVNASSEADPQGGSKQDVMQCVCKNCEFVNVLRPMPKPGDRP